MNKLRKYPTLLLLQIVFAVAAVVVAVVVLVEIRPAMEKKDQFDQKADSLSALRDTVVVLQRTRDNARLASEFLSKGIKSAERGRWSEAVSLYSKAIALDSTDPLTYDFRGYVFFKKKEYPAAIKDLERSVQLDSQYTWGHYNLALAYWRVDRQSEAIGEVKKVIALDSGFKLIIRDDGQFAAFKTSSEFRKLIQ